MDYNRVVHFVGVVKAGSFTAAAAAAGLPKSSISRSVTALEQELGVQLLQRTTRALALTDAGQAYYDAVQGSVAAITEAEAAVREHGAAPRGVVRLTSAPDVTYLAPALAAFAQEYPGIRVEATLTSRFVDLVSEGVDLAVRAGRLADSSLIARRVGTSEEVLMAAPSYLRKRGRPKTVADLADHDWVLYRAVHGRATIQLSTPTDRASVEVTGTIVADDMAFCRAAAEAGAGIALLPVLSNVGALAAGTLEQVLPGWTYAGASLYVVLPNGRHVPARVALLRDFLVAHLGKQIAAIESRCRKARPAVPPSRALQAVRRGV